MHLRDIRVENAHPVRLFEVDNLSSVVVIAGPNGVGKTRLIQRLVEHLRGAQPNVEIKGVIEASSPREADSWGGRRTLDMSSPGDMTLFRSVLQVNRRRHHWQSSLVNIESDRTIQALRPYQFTWDIVDPYEEEIGWETGFGYMRDRFPDTVHSIFRLIEAQKQGIASRAVSLRRTGASQMNLDFDDPMEPFKRVFSQLLAPKELVDPSARDQRLQYRLEGQTLEFSTLSSGEREVVNIAFDFLLRNPSDCIVFFDEPELHLHPELSYRLIQTLQTIGARNQFVLSTHSPEVISSSLDRSVVFLGPPRTAADGSPANQAIPVSEADETNQALRLLGHSIGIIALGKRIVLIEGDQSSLDKQTYGRITEGAYPDLVLVPSGGRHVIESFDAVYRSVLSRTLWGVQFYMLCDGDSAPPGGLSETTSALAEGRLRVLPRYHLENYFLDEHVWAAAFAAMEPPGSWLRSPEAIRAQLIEIAKDTVSYAVALSISSYFRTSVGNVDMMPSDCHGKTGPEVAALLQARAETEMARIRSALDTSGIEVAALGRFNEITESLNSEGDEWKPLVPGKPVLGRFAGKAGVTTARAKALYLDAAASAAPDPFREILDIFDAFAHSIP